MSVEERIEEWKEAKARADYEAADAIRAELRAEGVDPDKRRRTGGSRRETSAEDKIRQWQDAKARKDFSAADRIRSELRAQGIEPDPVGKGPPMYMTPAAPVAFAPPPLTTPRRSRDYEPAPFEPPYDARLEAQMDEWEEAREQKDWAAADEIRAALRSRGRSPAKERGGRRGSVDDELYQWQRAKQAKDFARSDRLRASLRDKGVDVDAKNRSSPHDSRHATPPTQYDMPVFPRQQTMTLSMDIALELSQWYDAKEAKDFTMADKIRDRVRSKGVEPKDCPRPAGSVRQLVADLAKWYEAKDSKDFKSADNLRGYLRDNGIEPQNCERPLLGAAETDDTAEESVRAWYEARDKKDWVVADSIRDELRSKGVEPQNCPRPASRVADTEDEETLARWYDAKDAKDWETADGIRDSLRAKGIEPSKCPRPNSGGGYGKVKAETSNARQSGPYAAPQIEQAGVFDWETEEKLDMWWLYKQEKDFANADKVRAGLRKMGVEPEQHRPKK